MRLFWLVLACIASYQPPELCKILLVIEEFIAQRLLIASIAESSLNAKDEHTAQFMISSVSNEDEDINKKSEVLYFPIKLGWLGKLNNALSIGSIAFGFPILPRLSAALSRKSNSLYDRARISGSTTRASPISPRAFIASFPLLVE